MGFIGVLWDFSWDFHVIYMGFMVIIGDSSVAAPWNCS